MKSGQDGEEAGQEDLKRKRIAERDRWNSISCSSCEQLTLVANSTILHDIKIPSRMTGGRYQSIGRSG